MYRVWYWLQASLCRSTNSCEDRLDDGRHWCHWNSRSFCCELSLCIWLSLSTHTRHTPFMAVDFFSDFSCSSVSFIFLLIFCLVSCSRLRWPAVIFERTLNCATCKLNILQVNPHYDDDRRHRHHHHHICHCILIFLLNLFLICASSWDRPKLFLFFCCLSAIAKFSR